MRTGRMKNCRALKILEHYTTPRQGRVFAWIIEIMINTLVIISALPALMGFPESMDWVLDYGVQYVTVGLIAANLFVEFLTSPVTYADKKRPFLNFVANPMNWLEVIAIVGLTVPGNGAWAAIAFVRLFKFIYLIGNNSTILIARHVTVKYGAILLEIVIISSAVLFMLSTGVLAIELSDPNSEAFQGQDIENIWDAFYYTFIASSTIGFGDISPVTFPAQIYTMFLAVYGIVIIALISSVFVAGFTDGAKKLTKIKAENRRQKVRIFEKMVDVERKIKINRTIDSLNNIIAKTKLNIKPITHVDIVKDVKLLRHLQQQGQEKTKEVDLDDIIAQAGKSIKRDANKDKYNEMEYVVSNAIKKTLGEVKAGGTEDRCHVGEKIKHRDIKAYCGVDGTVKEWSLNNSLRSGHWTLAVFFPVGFDDTSDEELKDLKENIQMFKDSDIDLLAITSQDMNTNRLWIDESFHGLPFGIASDKDGFYGKRFGFWDEAKHKNTRGSVVIDEKGIIQGIVSVGQDVSRTAEDLHMFANSIKERTNKNK